MLRPFAAAASLFALLVVAASAEAAVIEVTITGLSFSPAEVTAEVGDTIEWTNKDFVAHTATARDKTTFDVLIPAHGTGSLVVKAPGTVDYYCRFHPMMKGRIQMRGD
jgi:plastocyanin